MCFNGAFCPNLICFFFRIRLVASAYVKIQLNYIAVSHRHIYNRTISIEILNFPSDKYSFLKHTDFSNNLAPDTIAG